jgi:triphosphoribosyl-dephospho-CoA synthase
MLVACLATTFCAKRGTYSSGRINSTGMTNIPHDASRRLLEDQIRAACVFEATARKPGNVHPQFSFPDLTYQDFVASAHIVAPILAQTAQLGVGRAIFEAVSATQARVGRNTNLGIVLLLAPLAAVPDQVHLGRGIGDVLASLSRVDSDYVYEAIRLAQPGGMGEVAEQDLSEPPTATLLDVMRLAADRDLIARQYVENFSIVLEKGMLYLARVEDFRQHWEPAIVGLHLELLSQYPDSLIRRKCGLEIAEEASLRAAAVLKAARPGTRNAQIELNRFDRWLRTGGNRRNPGTTADLVAAALFAALREEALPLFFPSPAFPVDLPFPR